MRSNWYDATASGYNQLYASEQKEKLNVVAEKLKAGREWLLLDLGCGTGLSREFFHCRIVGLDPSFKLLLQSKLTNVAGIAEALPFKENVFDAVISTTAIHNFSDANAAVAEIKRVCKGPVAVTVLKKAKKHANIIQLLQKEFPSAEVVDSSKDTIFIYEG